jgi:hypothetical protein
MAEASTTTRVLVVANRTAAAPRLLDAVRRRAGSGPCRFTLLIPDAPNRRAADWTLDTALPLLSRAAGTPVASLVGGSDAFDAVRDAVGERQFDEIIVSTLPPRMSKWLRRDLIGRIEGLGLPVIAIVPRAPVEPDFDRLGDPKEFHAPFPGDLGSGPV